MPGGAADRAVAELEALIDRYGSPQLREGRAREFILRINAIPESLLVVGHILAPSIRLALPCIATN